MIIIREYQDTDYKACESLTSDEWEFEKSFAPIQLAELSKYLYTMGSVAITNFQKVIEVDGEVVGFIFGYNEKEPVKKHDLQRSTAYLWVLKTLLAVKKMSLKAKVVLLNNIRVHAKNRSKLVPPKKSEIMLFVVHPKHQGKGYGKELFSAFKDYCKGSDIDSVMIETNTLGASTFYEQLGCKFRGNFDSPLHAYTTENGQACIYEYHI